MPSRSLALGAMMTILMITGSVIVGCNRVRSDDHHPATIEGPGAVNGPTVGTVTAVVDGDTITVEFAAPFDRTETVRLLGIDTPEKPGGPRPPECGGDSASAFTTAVLPVGTAVLLARDIETRDVYGRLLAWVIRAEDATNVNLAIIEAGHATALSIAPNNALRSEVSVAADRARSDKRGFWTECGGPPYPLGEGE